MTRPSTRFAAALVAILGAAVGLRIGVLERARGEDSCASPSSLKATSLIPGTVALGERLEAFDEKTVQWSEGEVPVRATPSLPMRFQIIRSYDAPSLYGNPLALADWPPLGSAGAGAGHAMQAETLRLRTTASQGTDLPIHVAWDHTQAPRGPSRLVAWMYVFDNAPVRSPTAAQLRAALHLATRGPRPLTLLIVSAYATERSATDTEDAAVAWLGDAWAYVASACTAR